jgi:hypothetical protein
LARNLQIRDLFAEVKVANNGETEVTSGNLMNLISRGARINGLRVLLMVLAFTHVEEVSANNVYVGPGGDDANPGSLSRPFLTINKGISVLRAGDVLLIRGGTYKEAIDSNTAPLSSGTSSSNVITIEPFNDEQVTIQAPAGDAALNVEGSIHHTVWKDLILDAVHVRFGLRLADGAHHNRFQNIEVRNAQRSGILVSEGTGSTDFNEFIECKSHNNGSSVLDHGIYLETSNNLIDRGEYYDNSGFGIQLYNESPTVNRNVVRQVKVHHNGMFGILITSGEGNTAHDNVVCCNTRGGIEINWGTGTIRTSVFNNTIYNNGGESIAIGSNNINLEVRNNTLYQNADGIVDYGNSANIRATPYREHLQPERKR